MLDRVSVSPSEKKVCFEFQTGFKYTEPGRTLYIADFDAQKRTITNLKAIANEEGKPFWYAYPRWIDGEAAVVYHSDETGKGQLYVYRLEDGSTKRVSTNAGRRLPVSAWRSGSVLKTARTDEDAKELSARREFLKTDDAGGRHGGRLRGHDALPPRGRKRRGSPPAQSQPARSARPA